MKLGHVSAAVSMLFLSLVMSALEPWKLPSEIIFGEILKHVDNPQDQVYLMSVTPTLHDLTKSYRAPLQTFHKMHSLFRAFWIEAAKGCSWGPFVFSYSMDHSLTKYKKHEEFYIDVLNALIAATITDLKRTKPRLSRLEKAVKACREHGHSYNRLHDQFAINVLDFLRNNDMNVLNSTLLCNFLTNQKTRGEAIWVTIISQKAERLLTIRNHMTSIFRIAILLSLYRLKVSHIYQTALQAIIIFIGPFLAFEELPYARPIQCIFLYFGFIGLTLPRSLSIPISLNFSTLLSAIKNLHPDTFNAIFMPAFCVLIPPLPPFIELLLLILLFLLRHRLLGNIPWTNYDIETIDFSLPSSIFINFFPVISILPSSRALIILFLICMAALIVAKILVYPIHLKQVLFCLLFVLLRYIIRLRFPPFVCCALLPLSTWLFDMSFLETFLMLPLYFTEVSFPYAVSIGMAAATLLNGTFSPLNLVILIHGFIKERNFIKYAIANYTRDKETSKITRERKPFKKTQGAE